jgi:peptidoglycan hydrolase-like protein with peptidoglycan-binding domain
MLTSKLLSPDQRLKACEISDPSHVQTGDRGDFVKRIQQALIRIENAAIDDSELEAGLYGESTAAAVLAYKTKRKIVNRAYQSQADNIVGKMTIRSLDDELLKLEAGDSDKFFAAALRPIFGRLT